MTAPAKAPASEAIKVAPAVKARLWKLAAEQRAETGRAVSMSDVIEQLLDRQDGGGR